MIGCGSGLFRYLGVETLCPQLSEDCRFRLDPLTRPELRNTCGLHQNR